MENLLEVIRQGQISSLPELAERLQVSEELLSAKLERYEQLGVVKRVRMDASGCGGNCKRCRGCSSMGTGGHLVYWEKGENFNDDSQFAFDSFACRYICRNGSFLC